MAKFYTDIEEIWHICANAHQDYLRAAKSEFETEMFHPSKTKDTQEQDFAGNSAENQTLSTDNQTFKLLKHVCPWKIETSVNRMSSFIIKLFKNVWVSISNI